MVLYKRMMLQLAVKCVRKCGHQNRNRNFIFIFHHQHQNRLILHLRTHIALALDGVQIISNSSGSHHQLRKSNRRMDIIRSATAKVILLINDIKDLQNKIKHLSLK